MMFATRSVQSDAVRDQRIAKLVPLVTPQELYDEVPLDGVPALVHEIEDRLRASGHPFIVGSECDVLSMPGYEKTIMAKVMAFTTCGSAHG